MCHYTATLAKADECKMIACCEHDIIHLVWNRSRISLSFGEVQRLTPFLEQCRTQIDGGSFYDCYSLRYAPDGRYELGLGDLVLRLKYVEMQKLTDLLRQALNRLGEQSPRAFALAGVSAPLTMPVPTVYSNN